jgi:membrane protein DedA with SNARE-associated domain
MVIEGPIVSVIAGFLISLGMMSWPIAYFVIVVGDLVGDLMFYYIGKTGRLKWIRRWGKYIGLNEALIEKIEKLFKKHPGKTLLFGKFSHVVGAPVIIAAGMANMPVGYFLWWNFLGTMPKSLSFLILGFYFGQAYVAINQYLNDFFIVGFILIIILAVIFKLFGKIFTKVILKE